MEVRHGRGGEKEAVPETGGGRGEKGEQTEIEHQHKVKSNRNKSLVARVALRADVTRALQLHAR